MRAEIFFAISGLIVLAMGTGHLFLTFFTNKMDPRDPALSARMKEVKIRLSPVQVRPCPLPLSDSGHPLSSCPFESLIVPRSLILSAKTRYLKD